MKLALPFEKQDLFMLRNSLLFLVFSLMVSASAYFVVSYSMQNASRSAASALATFGQVTQSVQQIAQEEATVVRYIGRYREMELEGIVSEEDRLAFLEKIGEIRVANDLFPVNVEMGEQVSNSLEYDPNDINPGDPVVLRSTPINLSMSLLHEEDLTRLMDALLVGNGLILPTLCNMEVNNIGAMNFTQLGEHLQARCVLRLYTYDLNPPPPEPIDEY